MSAVLLCIPPDYDYNFPPLGTPALCGFLKTKDIPAEQIDLNLGYRDFLLRRLTGARLSSTQEKDFLKPILKKFFQENLRNRYYSQFLLRECEKDFPYLPYDNNTNTSFYFTERLLSSPFLWRYLADDEENTFCQFYREINILKILKEKDVRILGLSVISPSQALPTLTLGLLVKNYLPHVHVNIGGQWPTLYREALHHEKGFFNCFDSMIVFEGETPLYQLAVALREGREIKIPNCITKNGSAGFSSHHSEEDLNQLPCPDFDGLPLDKYEVSLATGAITLTLETSRGCYWSKCAYCVDLPLPKPRYRRKNPELVARDIKQLQEKYQAKRLMVSDPGLSPRQMLEVSRAILKEEVKLEWWCMARLDPGFNSEIFKTAKQAGLYQINFGFESANDRICGLLDKGNTRKRSVRIISECSQAGIKVDLQTILGLPTETIQEGLDTVDFLVQNQRFISDATFNVYYLTPDNFVYRHPEKYGIEYEKNGGLPFRFFIPFNNLKGMTKVQALLLQELYAWLTNNKVKTEDVQEPGLSRADVLSLAAAVSVGQVEFCLNQEKTVMPFLYHNVTKDYFFIPPALEGITEYLKKEALLADVYDALLKAYKGENFDSIFDNFIEHALAKGFVRNKTLELQTR